MSGLRFAFVTTFYPPHNFGGDGLYVQRWARALIRRGHDVEVLCDTDVYDVLRAEARSIPALATTEQDDDGIVVHRLQTGMARLSVLLTQQAGRPIVNGARIRRLLDEGGFDVINFHNVSGIGGPGILSAGHAIKLYTAHEHWLVCPSHVLWRHDREVCTGRQCLRCVLHYHRPPQLWRYTDYLDRHLGHVDAFIALSHFSRAKHREFGFPREMEVIPGFLPEEEPEAPDPVKAPAPPAPPHQRPFFLFVGRLERIKGLDDVIPVFERYTDADLLIVGDGTHRPTLEALARDNPRIHFLGARPYETLGRYYEHAVAAIVPTAGFETAFSRHPREQPRTPPRGHDQPGTRRADRRPRRAPRPATRRQHKGAAPRQFGYGKHFQAPRLIDCPGAR